MFNTYKTLFDNLNRKEQAAVSAVVKMDRKKAFTLAEVWISGHEGEVLANKLVESMILCRYNQSGQQRYRAYEVNLLDCVRDMGWEPTVALLPAMDLKTAGFALIVTGAATFFVAKRCGMI